MPSLSTFYGIIIWMYKENGNKHNIPHIHAEYGEYNVVISLEGDVLEGNFPENKKKLIDAWMVLHREELEANWKLLSLGQKPEKIQPLR